MEKKYTSQEVEIILQNFGKDNGMSSNGIYIKRWWNTWETEHSANTSVVELAMTSLLGSKTPIEEYYKGLPCMLGEVVGKIVGESDEGSWGEINGVKMFSLPLFATPHGTIIKTGVMGLSKITDEGRQKLSEYEKQVIYNGDKLYGGCLD